MGGISSLPQKHALIPSLLNAFFSYSFHFPRKPYFPDFHQPLFYHHSSLCFKETLPLVLESPLELGVKTQDSNSAFHCLAMQSFSGSSEDGFLKNVILSDTFIDRWSWGSELSHIVLTHKWSSNICWIKKNWLIQVFSTLITSTIFMKHTARFSTSLCIILCYSTLSYSSVASHKVSSLNTGPSILRFALRNILAVTKMTYNKYEIALKIKHEYFYYTCSINIF